MITHLHIENYALIEHLDIDLDEGFSVITGETGAGKSILLGALGLLLGKRADSKAIKDGAKKCIIEADFTLNEHHLHDFFEEQELDFDGTNITVRRELTASGKSRAFVNDTPVSLNVLEQLGACLIDIHSQHQNLLLNRQNYQLSVLDTVAGNAPLLLQYAACYEQWQKAKTQLAETQKELEAQRANQDYLQFQYDKLTQAKLQEGEQEELEQEQQTLEHAEDIKSALYQALDALSDDERGIVQSLRQTQRQLGQLSGIYNPANDYALRIDSCYIELKDIAAELEDAVNGIEYDPARLQWVSDRLSLIYELQQKYHLNSVSELLQLQQQTQEKLAALENDDEILRQLQTAIAQHESQLQALSEELTTQRKAAAERLEDEMVRRLQPLGMPKVRFQVEMQRTKTYEKQGCDSVQFLFSANLGLSLQPISQIASGGEIARVMLSIKALLSQQTMMPTIIFDEIDTGVSGTIAEAMAHTMRKMSASQGHQVISITHLPQIAALGAHHYKVYKDEGPQGTVSHITPLSPDERVQEIAHMLSGATLTQAAIDNAHELISQSK